MGLDNRSAFSVVLAGPARVEPDPGLAQTSTGHGLVRAGAIVSRVQPDRKTNRCYRTERTWLHVKHRQGCWRKSSGKGRVTTGSVPVHTFRAYCSDMVHVPADYHHA